MLVDMWALSFTLFSLFASGIQVSAAINAQQTQSAQQSWVEHLRSVEDIQNLFIDEDSHKAHSDTSTILLLHSETDLPSKLGQFFVALQSLMESLRPAKANLPYVKFRLLDRRDVKLFSFFNESVIASQAHLAGQCVKCITPSDQKELIAFHDGKLCGIYPNSEELLSCSCDCGAAILCPNHPCCTNIGDLNINQQQDSGLVQSEIEAKIGAAEICSFDNFTCLDHEENSNNWRAQYCWPPSCSQDRAASIFLRWLMSIESHHARRVQQFYAQQSNRTDSSQAEKMAKVLRLSATERKIAMDSFIDKFKQHDLQFVPGTLATPPFGAGIGDGQGIVIPAGGAFLLTNTWLAVKNIRRTGCKLPIEIWYNGVNEMPIATKRAFESISGVACRNLHDYIHHDAMARFFGTSGVSRASVQRFEIKPFAALFSHFQEVLLLDSDNIPLRDPTFLFSHPAFTSTGAVFWPDYRELDTFSEIWDVMGVQRPVTGAVEQDSGELLIDKRRSWLALNILCYVASNGRSAYFFNKFWGDKEYWHLSWRRAGLPFHMIQHYPGSVAPNASDSRSPTGFCGGSMLHFGPDALPLFMHCTLTERSPRPKFDRRWGVLKLRQPITLEIINGSNEEESDWANESKSVSMLLQGRDQEAYYATHDYQRRLICVDIPDPSISIDLCTVKHQLDPHYQLFINPSNLCSTETTILRDLRGLQSHGGPDFVDTPWYTELVRSDSTYSSAVDQWKLSGKDITIESDTKVDL